MTWDEHGQSWSQVLCDTGQKGGTTAETSLASGCASTRPTIVSRPPRAEPPRDVISTPGGFEPLVDQCTATRRDSTVAVL